VRIQAVKVRDGVAITASDITARKRNEEQILYLAHHDPLTGLMNRSLLTDRITQAINRSNRNCSYTGIFLIDVDCFKEVNDTLGHATGDAALVVIANRLQRAVRVVDSVVRLGGDEFVVVMPEIRQRFDVENCAKRILRAFEPRIAANGHSLVLHCSIGVAVYPESAQTCEELLSKADAAMYLAKRRGKNQFEIHAPRAGSQQTSEDWLTAEPVPLSE
jgi:diguanylate cyclase (GGDEF)-like protein